MPCQLQNGFESRPVRHILHCGQLSPPKRSTLQSNPIEPPDFFAMSLCPRRYKTFLAPTSRKTPRKAFSLARARRHSDKLYESRCPKLSVESAYPESYRHQL